MEMTKSEVLRRRIDRQHQIIAMFAEDKSQVISSANKWAKLCDLDIAECQEKIAALKAEILGLEKG